MKILIKGVLLEGATKDIFLNNGVIEYIGDSCPHAPDKIINGKNKAALPAFINGHTHAAMTLFRGYADDMQLKPWLEEKIWPLEAKLTPEDVYWGTKLACLEMIKNGVTVFNDMYWHWEATSRAVCDMKVRGLVSAVFIDMFDEKKSDEQIDENLRLFEISKKYRPYVTFTLGPHGVYTVSKKSLEWMRDFSEKEDLLIHMHLSETDGETVLSREKYRLTPTEFLDSLGVLSERYIGCHGCALSEKDVEIIGRTKSKLVHVPVSNLKLAVDSLFPYTWVEKQSVPYCFGTDGCASNNHLDMMETVKFAALLAKFSTHDPTKLPARQAFSNATKTAASIFRLGNWEIAAGMAPDIILIDLNRPEFVPNFDLFSDIVYAANSSCVDTVICMGEVLMENRYVPGEEEIMEKARSVAVSLIKK